MQTNPKMINKIQSVGALVALVLVFTAVLIVNQKEQANLNLSNASDSNRTIASNNIESGTSNSNQMIESQLIHKVARLDRSSISRLARPQSPLDQFLFEELRGHYVMGLTDNKIKGLKLKTDEKTQALNLSGQEAEFLMNHRGLWWIDFESTGLKSRSEPHTIINLYNKNHQLVGEAQFENDLTGRLANLTLEKL